MNSLWLLMLISLVGPLKVKQPADNAISLANIIHPIFPFLDANGKKVIDSGLHMDTDTTCGNCHDTVFIDSHNSHHKETVDASCLQCHLPLGKFPIHKELLDEAGIIKKEFVTIGKPKPANCALCHGVIHSGLAPLTLPEDYGRIEATQNNPNYFDLTKWTGEIISGQKMMDSYLNLAGKEYLASPWDVHAERLVDCSACHYTRNNPQKTALKDDRLSSLTYDPRKISISQYLHRPDHRLTTETCTRCHDPLQIHKHLPYPEQHFARLDCRTCHSPKLFGPAWKTIDYTVLTSAGQPRITYRGMKTSNPKHFSAAYLKGYQPYLLWRVDENGVKQLAPYNLVTSFRWVFGNHMEMVPLEKLQAAYFDQEAYAPKVIKAFDTDHNGILSYKELRLDSPSKIDVIQSRLASAGVPNPRIQTTVIPYQIHHGIQGKTKTTYDCRNCHSRESRLNETISLANYSIPGATVVIANPDQVLLSGVTKIDKNGDLVYRRSFTTDTYIFGHDRAPWSDSLGLIIFLATIIGIAIHSLLRFYTKHRRSKPIVPTEKAYLYSLYERIWHWLMALSVLLLAVTGIEIHWMNEGSLLGFENAVELHNLLAVVMVINAILSFFYHLASGDIRHFIPPKKSLVAEVIAQTKYYLNGIFVGALHPVAKTPQRKLNSLQQITYMILLNLLFPFQVITGVLIWGISRWPDLSDVIGGLTIITPLHNFGAWILITFILAHVYLTTTGHTIFSNIRAMISGYDEIEIAPSSKRR